MQKQIFRILIIFVLACQENFDNAGLDVHFSEILPNTDVQEVSSTFCGAEIGNCPAEFICYQNVACCQESLPQLCGNQCFPAECICVVDGEIELCLNEGWYYCGGGISCKKNETCQQIDGQYHCVLAGYIYCNETRVCADFQVCTENTCCPNDQPIECGETCCLVDEQCADSEKSLCLPSTATYCNGVPCFSGTICAPDGLPVCYPENGDYCGNGRWCDPGWKCTATSCCPEGTPQECGNLCCHKDYQCAGNGLKCIFPGSEYCPETGIVCDSGNFCALDGTICLPDNTDVCDDGHWCEPGQFCADSTCCPYQEPMFCGNLCCPKNWICVGDGVDCVPPDSEYCEISGKSCPFGTKCASDGECMPSSWKDCGTGLKCPPNFVCAGNGKKCCSKTTPYLCGDECCPDAEQCMEDKGLCLPKGAIYCHDIGPKDYCPAGTYCGKSGCISNALEECANGMFCLWGTCGKTVCLPIGWEECNNTQLCQPKTFCTENPAGPTCCSDSQPVVCNGFCCPDETNCCGKQCCPDENTCQLVNNEPTCLLLGSEICPVGEDNYQETVCGPDTFCEEDGYCLNDIMQGQPYDYCGGGNTCSIFECAGLCSNFCCADGQTACLKTCCVGSPVICRTYPGTLDPYTALSSAFEQCDDYYTSHPEWINPYVKNGVYHAECDADGKWLKCKKVGEELLVIEGIWVIDNLEELAGWHGPFAKWSFHILPGNVFNQEIFQKSCYCCYYKNNKDDKNDDEVKCYPDIKPGDIPAGGTECYLCGPPQEQVCLQLIKDKSLYGYKYEAKGPHLLKGPHRDPAADFLLPEPNDEWLVNEFLRYNPGKAGIYKWGKYQWEGNDSIYLSFQEHDHDDTDDLGGIEYVERAATKNPCGLWLPLYRYENLKWLETLGNAYNVFHWCLDKQKTIVAFIWLRTIVCTEEMLAESDCSMF